MRKIIFICLVIISCKSPEDCEKFYNKYVDLQFEFKNEESLIELEKAISCDSKNEIYLFEKVRYYIKLNNYSDAKKNLIKLGKLNDIYVNKYPLKGLLEIKEGNSEFGKKSLRIVFNNLEKIDFNKDNFNDYYYYLLLKNFFEQFDLPLNITSIKNVYEGEYELSLLKKFIEMKDSQKDSLEILNKIFNLENSDGG